MLGFPPKSSILIGFSNINHLFWGTPIFENTQMPSEALEMQVFLKVQLLNFLSIPGVYILKTLT